MTVREAIKKFLTPFRIRQRVPSPTARCLCRRHPDRCPHHRQKRPRITFSMM